MGLINCDNLEFLFVDKIVSSKYLFYEFKTTAQMRAIFTVCHPVFVGWPPLPLLTNCIPSSPILEENWKHFECYDSFKTPYDKF